MLVKVKKRKAGSYKDLAFEEYKVDKAATLEELLTQISAVEIEKLRNRDETTTQTDIGKISFGLYDGRMASLEQSMKTAKQDFEDGLFRVFWNGEECTEWNETLECIEENELVIIRLIMMAGRLW